MRPHNWVVPFDLAVLLLVAEANRLLEEDI
jgi:hypothetical protein